MNDDTKTSGAIETGASRPAVKFVIVGGRKSKLRGDQVIPTQPVDTNPFQRLKIETQPVGREILAQVLLGTGDTLVFTAPRNLDGVMVYLTNVDAAPNGQRKVEVHHVVKGGASSDTNARRKNTTLEIGGEIAVSVDGMASGDMIRGLCDSANKVTCSVYGRRMDQ